MKVSLVFVGALIGCNWYRIDPVGKLLFSLEKNQYWLLELHLSRLFAHPVEGITWVNIAVIESFLDAYKIIICQNNNGVHTLS